MSPRRLHVWLVFLTVFCQHTSSILTSSIQPSRVETSSAWNVEEGIAIPTSTGQPPGRSSLTLQRPATYHGPGQVFVKFGGVVCVEQEPDAMFSIDVGTMFTHVRGDGQLPEQFQETNLVNGGTVWRIKGHLCELRIAPTVGLPKSVIKSIWELGVQDAIRQIYINCVHQEMRGGAQLWAWYGGEGAELVIVEIAILKLRQDKTGHKQNPCVIC
ncbi:hypothetical protein MMC26_005587 [Xylographa opegraphella]|nr:hypothetical protein [Xylographa opegraphella]